MRNIRLDLQYEGSRYFGWQWQPDQPTIEAEVKKAVEKLVQHEIKPSSSGRTDAGVHAEQHVFHFFSETRHEKDTILRAMNALLPNDIAVKRVVDMPLKWNARHDALEREYWYRFYCSDARDVFWFRRSYWVRKPMDVELMRQGAQYFVGKHDFSAFRSAQCEAEHAVRRILSVDVVQEGAMFIMKVRGHAFLHHQVRIMAGTLFKVGLGKWPPEYVEEILNSKDRFLAGKTLAAHGLTLQAVRYEGEDNLGKED